MKQNITVDDLNMLTEQGKQRLREWWTPEDGDKFYGNAVGEQINTYLIGECVGDGETAEPSVDALPLLSIGMMIDFLSGPFSHIDITVTDMGPMAFVNVYYNHPIYAANELCDALWQAVKDILNKEG